MASTMVTSIDVLPVAATISVKEQDGKKEDRRNGKNRGAIVAASGIPVVIPCGVAEGMVCTLCKLG